MKKMAHWMKHFYIEHPQAIFDFILILFGIGSLFYEKAFLFNPLFLASLFLIYYRGFYALLTFGYLAISISFIKSFTYGLEVLIILCTYLFLNYFIHKIKKDRQIKFLALIVINIFLITMSLINEFSYTSIINIMAYLLLQFLIIYTFDNARKIIYEKSSHESLAVPLFCCCLAFIFMYLDNMGLIVFRLFSLMAMVILTKTHKTLYAMVCWLVLFLFYHFSLETQLLVMLPLLLVMMLPKWRLIGYVSTHVIMCLFFTTPILFNPHFYSGLAAALVFLLVPKDFDEALRAKLYPVQEKMSIINTPDFHSYLDVVEQAFDVQEVVEGEYLEKAIKRETCSKCDHLKHCQIKNSINEFLHKKLSKDQKDDISARCLSPYKLTLALQDGYQKYERELEMMNDNNRQRQQVQMAIKNLKLPLEGSETREKPWSLKDIYADYGIELEDSNEKLTTIDISIAKNVYLNCPDTIKEAMKRYNSDFEFVEAKYDALLHQVNIHFELKALNDVDIGEVTFAKIASHNGDNYKIIAEEGLVQVILCDGMGSGQKAEQNSSYLLNAFTQALKVHPTYEEALDDVNRLLHLKSRTEQYSTLDYARIDLRTLVMTMVKAGSFSSYLFRSGRLKIIPNNSLPLGIIDEVNINPTRYQLQSGDILFIMSDGLGEQFEKYKAILKWHSETAMELARTIYQQITQLNAINDDATIITIKIL